MLRDADDPVVRPGLPEPVGGRFGIIAKALFARSKGLFGPLAVLNIVSRAIPFGDVAQLIAQWLSLEQKPAIFTIDAPEPGLEPAPYSGRLYGAPLLQHTLLVVRMKRARPAKPGLVQREAGKVERRFIEEVRAAVRSSAPDQRRDCIGDQSKPVFRSLDFIKRPLQLLPCFVLLGDIHVRTDQLDHIPLAVDDWMSDGMHAPHRSVRTNYPKIDFEIRFLPDCPLRYLGNPRPVFGK